MRSSHGRRSAASMLGFGNPMGGPPLPHGLPVINAPGYDQNLALSGQLLAQLKADRAARNAPVASAPSHTVVPMSAQDQYNSHASEREAARSAMEQLMGRQKEQDAKFAHEDATAKQRHTDRLAEIEAENKFKGGENDKNRELKKGAQSAKEKHDAAVLDLAQKRLNNQISDADFKHGLDTAKETYHQDLTRAQLGQKDQIEGTQTTLPGKTVQPGAIIPATNRPAAMQEATPTQPVTSLDRATNGDFVQAGGDIGSPPPSPAATSSAQGAGLNPAKTPKLERDMQRRAAEKGSEEDAAIQKAVAGFNTENQGKSILDQVHEIGYQNALIQGLPQDWQQNPKIKAFMQPTSGGAGGLGVTSRIVNTIMGNEREATPSTWNTEKNHERAGLVAALGGEGPARKYALALAQRAKDLTTDPSATPNPNLDPDAATEASRAYKQYLVDKKRQDDAFAAEQGAKNAPGALTRFGRGFVKPFEAIPETLTHLPEAASQALGLNAFDANSPQQAAAMVLQKALDPTGAKGVVAPIADSVSHGDYSGGAGEAAGQVAQMMLMNKLSGVAPELNNPIANKISGAGGAMSRIGGRGWAGLPGRVLKEAGDFLKMPERTFEPTAGAPAAGDTGTPPAGDTGTPPAGGTPPSGGPPNAPVEPFDPYKHAPTVEELQGAPSSGYKNLSPDQVRAMQQMGIPADQIAKADALATPSVKTPTVGDTTVSMPAVEATTTDIGATDAANAVGDQPSTPSVKQGQAAYRKNARLSFNPGEVNPAAQDVAPAPAAGANGVPGAPMDLADLVNKVGGQLGEDTLNQAGGEEMNNPARVTPYSDTGPTFGEQGTVTPGDYDPYENNPSTNDTQLHQAAYEGSRYAPGISEHEAPELFDSGLNFDMMGPGGTNSPPSPQSSLSPAEIRRRMGFQVPEDDLYAA